MKKLSVSSGGEKNQMGNENYAKLETNKICKILGTYILHDKLHQAVLLEAPWGTGKTWYLKHNFIPSFSKKEEGKNWQFVYVSLFGLSNLSELEEKIEYEMVNSVFNSYSQSAIKRKIPSKLCNLTDVGVRMLLKYAGGFDELNYSKLISLLPKTDHWVYIFDDMERTKIDIVELLGHINDLCENNGNRVIIVANEEQILLRYKQLGDQYSGNYQGVNDRQDNNKDNDKDTQSQAMTLYNQAKEKAVSLTIKFQMNPDEAFRNVLESIVEDKKIKDLILQQEGFIMDLFNQSCEANKEVDSLSNINLVNLRILSFICVIADDLIPLVIKCFEEIQRDKKLNMNESEFDNAKSNVLPELLRYIAIACFDFKMGNRLKEQNFSYFTKEKQFIYFRYQYSFVSDFVVHRSLDNQKVKMSLISVIKEFILSHRRENSPLEHLYKWHYLDDEEVIRLLKQLKQESLPSPLEPGYVRNLIVLLLQLEHVGFDVDIKAYIFKILATLQSMEKLPFTKEALVPDPYVFANNDLLSKYNEVMGPIYQCIDHELSDNIKKEYSFLIKNEWNEDFPSQCARSNSFLNNRKFLGYIDVSSALQKLKESHPSEICYFHSGIRKVYNFDNIKDFFKADLPAVEQLLVGINEIIKSLEKTPNIHVKMVNLNQLREYLKFVKDKLQ